jgi:hypothetical protein
VEFDMKIDNADAEMKTRTTIYSIIFLNKFILTIVTKNKEFFDHEGHEEQEKESNYWTRIYTDYIRLIHKI